MNRFVIHPVWPVTNPHQLEYGLYLVTGNGERELSRSCSLDQVERLLRRLYEHRAH